MKLNTQQQQAIEYLGGPLFVLAGAGSGKTRVITEKISYMIQEIGYKPYHIAAITFTNKAAEEMKERIAIRLGKELIQGLTVCTFHSLGMRMLREDALHIGYKSNFSILDTSDTMSILTELADSSGKEALSNVRHQISLWKNDLVHPDEAFQAASDEWIQYAARIYGAYQQTLESYHAVDFDDLIRLPVLLLRNHSELRLKWQQRFRYILIDECQDTNACQYELIKLLAGLEGMFTAVGDDDQSIYAWRGANMENLRQLQVDYPQLKVIKLEQNYRSTARILRVANQVIANNPKLFPKTLWSQLGEGEVIKVIACQNNEHEAKYVVGQIAQMKHMMNANWSDFAILYRGNHQARVFEEALRESKILYQLSGGQSFYEKAEIKDILAYMRLLVNIDDDPAFLRAATKPKRGIGKTTLKHLNEYAKEHHCGLFQAAITTEVLASLNTKSEESIKAFTELLLRYQQRASLDRAGEVIRDLLNELAYEDYLLKEEENPKLAEARWRNVLSLQDWIDRKGQEDKNILEITQTIALMNLLAGKEEDEIDAVKLSTLHASKGLEYPYVFLVGCEEGILPHADSIDDGHIDEERRLMYVGITRAKRQLTLTHCIKRKREGTWQFQEPSRFIDEMPAMDLEILGRKDTAPIVTKEEGKRQINNMLEMLKQKGAGKLNQ